MSRSCPAPEDLLRIALEGGLKPLDRVIDRHVRECPRCARELAALRDTMFRLRTVPRSTTTARTSCLDESEIAAIADGFGPGEDPAAIRHLASCGTCRAQLAAVMRLREDPAVSREIGRIEASGQTRRGPRVARLAAAGLVAAALAGVTLGPRFLRTGSAGHGTTPLREPAITTAAAPRIVGPRGPATQADSLRWTSVPRADLYRVTVWNREGTVVWKGETRDTVLPLGEARELTSDSTVLWEVKARTGFGRWVASDLAELTVR